MISNYFTIPVKRTKFSSFKTSTYVHRTLKWEMLRRYTLIPADFTDFQTCFTHVNTKFGASFCQLFPKFGASFKAHSLCLGNNSSPSSLRYLYSVPVIVILYLALFICFVSQFHCVLWLIFLLYSGGQHLHHLDFAQLYWVILWIFIEGFCAVSLRFFVIAVLEQGKQCNRGLRSVPFIGFITAIVHAKSQNCCVAEGFWNEVLTVSRALFIWVTVNGVITRRSHIDHSGTAQKLALSSSESEI